MCICCRMELLLYSLHCQLFNSELVIDPVVIQACYGEGRLGGKDFILSHMEDRRRKRSIVGIIVHQQLVNRQERNHEYFITGIRIAI